jgi:protoporphyrinogen oxidase
MACGDRRAGARVRVAVLGAGVAGLAAAHRLCERGARCDVYERWPGLGGQAATLPLDGCDPLERYYHHLFTSDRHIAALYESLGMADAIEWRRSSVAVFSDGVSHAFTSPLDLLRFKPLSLRARVRMGLAVLRLQRRADEGVAAYESMTARAWIESEMGAQAWEKVWGPLLRGKFGARADDISMGWLWGKLTVRRQVQGESRRTELLGYPRGGFQPLFERLRERIESSGGRVLIDRPAAALAREGDGFRVAAGTGGSFRRGHDPRAFDRDGDERYDAVLATVPSDVFAGLLDDDLRAAVGPSYLGRLGSITYHAALCMLLEIDRRFSPFYWTNIADPSVPFVGLIEHTNFVEPERYGGRRFLYVANYLEHGHELLSLSPEELLQRYEPGLRRVNPEFDRGWIRDMRLFQEPAAQPIVDVGYRERIPPLATDVPGLLLANTTQIYPEDRGTNYAVRLGHEVADLLLGQDVGSSP